MNEDTKEAAELAWSLHVQLSGTVSRALAKLATRLEAGHFNELSESFIDGVTTTLMMIERQMNIEDGQTPEV